MNVTDILRGLGGKENIEGIDHCVTRLRLIVRDMNKINEQVIKNAGALGIFYPSANQVHVVIGKEIMSVFKEFRILCK